MAEQLAKAEKRNGLAVYASGVCARCGNGLPIDDKKTGERVRLYRTDLGISQDEMAKAMKISAAYLSDLELGKRAWDHALLEGVAAVLSKAE